MTEPALSFVGVWTALIALGVILYVLLDGFDLGVGMLHGFARDAGDREPIMNTIARLPSDQGVKAVDALVLFGAHRRRG